MTFQTHTSNTDLVSLGFHVLTIALVGLFTVGAVLNLAVQFA
jgi:hypothetical protein